MSVKINWYLVGFLAIGFLCMTPEPDTYAQQSTTEFFRQNCFSCHTIGGGRRTGPDLKNVSERKSRDWLAEFIMNPEQVINSGDPYAVKMKQEFNGVVMRDVPGVDQQLANALLDLIERESRKEESEFAGSQISNRPLTTVDVQRGKEYFLGLTPLENGGPACISCHTVNGYDGLLGGGTLGLNLTNAFGRLQGRDGLTSWLTAPPSQTMQPVYQGKQLSSEEILALTAYLRDQHNQNVQASTAPKINFLLIGGGGAVLLLILFDFLWGDRFRGVRKPLVQRMREEAAEKVDANYQTKEKV